MGSNNSHSDSDGESSVPIVLTSHDVKGVAEFIKASECKKIFVMVGAGLSVAAGIPDFRSPETGLYANLERFDLPYPEAIFELSFFRERPEAFYAFAKDFDPSVFRPTLAHSFLNLLHKKGRLELCFTQNIDGLERRTGLPEHKLVEAHGTIATAHCTDCHAAYETDKLWDQIRTGDLAHCERCDAIVKPDIVFFGESLPARFATSAPLLRSADLLLILGTSLKVWPFAGLTRFVGRGCPRVLINLEEAGDIGTQPNDALCLGKCDDVVRELCRELGWEAELDAEWATTRAEREVGDGVPVRELQASEAKEGEERAKAMGKTSAKNVAESLNSAQVDKLADVIARQLSLADEREKDDSDTTHLDQASSEVKKPVEAAAEKPKQDNAGGAEDDKAGKL
jgi:NAD-dependent histone deacetylase SIR2